MIALYLAVQAFRGLFWCFGAMIWLCFATTGAMLVLVVGAAAAMFGDGGRLLRRGFRALAPPAYLRIKSHT